MKKKIAYITGSRAEYGIVKRLLAKLQADETLEFFTYRYRYAPCVAIWQYCKNN